MHVCVWVRVRVRGDAGDPFVREVACLHLEVRVRVTVRVCVRVNVNFRVRVKVNARVKDNVNVHHLPVSVSG